MATRFLHPLTQPGAAPLEQRVRRPVALRARASRDDGSTVEAVVTDLSFEGCRLQSASALKAGEAIRLIVHDRGSLRATVQWVSGTKAGLLFLPEPAPAAGPEKVERRHERISLAAEITLRRAGKLSFRVPLFDLSPAGCKAEFVERPELHEPLWVKFDAMEAIEATVRWIAGSRIGIGFARPIHPAVFDLLVTRFAC
jgi:PilZ domain-containing protein